MPATPAETKAQPREGPSALVNCLECGCGHADVFLEVSACFLFELHLVSVFRRLCLTATVCCAVIHEAALAQADVVRIRVHLYTSACNRPELSASRLIPRGQKCAFYLLRFYKVPDLFLGFVNGVARLQRQQLRRTAATYVML